MKPPLRFAKTVDGGNVAYTVVGDGYPLMDFTGGPACNAVVEWETPNVAAFFEGLSERLSVIRVEPRGGPNSGPPPAERKYRDYILDDIDAVADHMGLTRFAAIAYGAYAEHLAAYAARRPLRLSHLVFGMPITQGFDADWPANQRAVAEMTQRWGADVWTLHTQAFLGNADENVIAAYARLLRSTQEGPNIRTWGEKGEERNLEIDLTPYIPLIEQPALVVADPRTAAAARELAASLGNSRLVQWSRHPFAMIERDESRAAAEDVIQFITNGLGSGSPPETLGTTAALLLLTPREREILALIAAGHSNAEIADALVLSTNTVARHIANSYAKLGIHNRTQAAIYALGAAREGHA